MKYYEALDFLQELTKFGFNFGLGRIEELMQRLGSPHQKLNIIHVGGTNGKGSTVSMISSIMQKAGYRVGVFTSPHLHSYTERYQINNVCISEEEMADYIYRLKPHLEKMVEEGFEHPTEFEVCTALAFLYFFEAKVDYVVLEVGLGGAIDSTNVANPLIAVITNVAMDHMDYLGNSIGEIATVKAGIIKPNGKVVTAVQKPEALKVIRSRAAEQKAELVEVLAQAQWFPKETTLRGQSFDLTTKSAVYNDLFIPLLGTHQLLNAATAVVTLETLERLGIKIGQVAVKEGLKAVYWPARLEIVRDEPMVVLDGAHNVDGAKSLRQSLQKDFSYNQLVLVFGMLGDKEREKVIGELAPLASRVIVTKPNSPRAGEWERMADEVKKYVDNVTLIADIQDAVKEAILGAGPKDLICVTGSLYMVAEARELFLKDK